MNQLVSWMLAFGLVVLPSLMGTERVFAQPTTTALKDALKAYQSGDLGLAEAIANAGLKENPGNLGLLALRGEVRFWLGKVKEADRDLSEVIQKQPRNSQALTTRSIVRRNLGRLDDALKDIQAALAINPKDHEGRYNCGLILVDLDRTEEGIKEFDLAIATYDQDPDYFADRGRAKLQKDPKGALKDTAQAVKLSETNDTGGKTSIEGVETSETPQGRAAGQGKDRYYLLYGNALQVLEKLKEAEDAYTNAIKHNKKNARAFANRAVVRLQLGDKENAKADLSTLAKLDSELFDALMKQLKD
jgi:tetratricopeptide (TPR) repeat protein